MTIRRTYSGIIKLPKIVNGDEELNVRSYEYEKEQVFPLWIVTSPTLLVML